MPTFVKNEFLLAVDILNNIYFAARLPSYIFIANKIGHEHFVSVAKRKW